MLAYLGQLIDLGGPVIGVLMLASLLLWALIIERYWFFYYDYPAMQTRQVQYYQPYCQRADWTASAMRELLLSQNQMLLEKHQSSIRFLIKLCPLLGLLGTVSGMIGVFDVIASTGNSDVKAMAAGIYRATLPTMAGLILALSALYFSHQIRHQAEQKQAQLSAALNRREAL